MHEEGVVEQAQRTPRRGLGSGRRGTQVFSCCLHTRKGKFRGTTGRRRHGPAREAPIPRGDGQPCGHVQEASESRPTELAVACCMDDYAGCCVLLSVAPLSPACIALAHRPHRRPTGTRTMTMSEATRRYRRPRGHRLAAGCVAEVRAEGTT